LRKRNAIFKHQSQKDRPVFPGDDAREFWVRAEDRNRETARKIMTSLAWPNMQPWRLL
jgi:glucosamine-6-phosphate deaminase